MPELWRMADNDRMLAKAVLAMAPASGSRSGTARSGSVPNPACCQLLRFSLLVGRRRGQNASHAAIVAAIASMPQGRCSDHAVRMVRRCSRASSPIRVARSMVLIRE